MWGERNDAVVLSVQRSLVTNQEKHTRLGHCVALIGGFVILTASGVIPVDGKDLHSPSAVLFLCGIVFLAGGIAIVFPSNRRLTISMVVIILVSFLVIGLWITFLGDARYFSGGIPFVSREANAVLARTAFGLGALITFGILLIALRDLFRANFYRKNNSDG